MDVTFLQSVRVRSRAAQSQCQPTIPPHRETDTADWEASPATFPEYSHHLEDLEVLEVLEVLEGVRRSWRG